MTKKFAGMSSEFSRIYSLEYNHLSGKYQLFMQDIQQKIKNILQTKLKNIDDIDEKNKIEILLTQISKIIEAMGVIKFVVTFAGLPDYAREYTNIWDNPGKLKMLFTTLKKININVNSLLTRFMYIYDHPAFAGDLDVYSANHELNNSPPGTYLVRISQKNSPGGFTISFNDKEKTTISTSGFFFTGNSNEIVCKNNKTYENLTILIEQFNFGLKLTKPVKIYDLYLYSSWDIKNKY